VAHRNTSLLLTVTRSWRKDEKESAPDIAQDLHANTGTTLLVASWLRSLPLELLPKRGHDCSGGRNSATQLPDLSTSMGQDGISLPERIPRTISSRVAATVAAARPLTS
jgi:hypothetical protein